MTPQNKIEVRFAGIRQVGKRNYFTLDGKEIPNKIPIYAKYIDNIDDLSSLERQALLTDYVSMRESLNSIRDIVTYNII